MKPIKSFMHAGLRVQIVFDPDPISPMSDYSLGTMICWHSKYNLGNKHDFRDEDSLRFSLLGDRYNWLEEKRDNQIDDIRQQSDLLFEDPRYSQVETDLNRSFRAEVDEALHEKYVILPLYLYNHGGLTMNTAGFSDRWDSGQVGCIYVSLEKAENDLPLTFRKGDFREQIEGILRAEVASYDKYLQGEVYGYRICKEDEEYCEEEDSLWGIAGMDECINMAKSAAESCAKRMSEENRKKTLVVMQTPLTDAEQANYSRLKRDMQSGRDDDVVLVRSLDTTTGKPIALICEVNRDGGRIELVTLAQICGDFNQLLVESTTLDLMKLVSDEDRSKLDVKLR